MRVKAKECESKINSKLKETLTAMEEMTFRETVFKSCKTELKNLLAKAKFMEEGVVHLKEQRAQLAELEKEVEVFRVEKNVVLVVMDYAKKFYLEGIVDHEVQISRWSWRRPCWKERKSLPLNCTINLSE
jgi:hypothetical protein